MTNPVILFCDFDGTITTRDTLEGFMQLFMDEDIQIVSRRMFEQGYSVKQGVREILCRVTEEDYLAHMDYFENLPLREGFAAFLDFLTVCRLPLVVISGGIRGMVETTLAPYRAQIQGLYAADVEFSSGRVRIFSDYESEEEIVSKQQVMALYSCERAVCIGDSYTDFRMALACDLVFARDRLAEAMEKVKKPYYNYETFYDIMVKLKELQERGLL